MKVAVLGLCVLLLAGIPGAASGSGAAATTLSPRTVTVTGTGIVSAVPDRAQFSFGVTNVAKTATAALAANGAAMEKVIAALKGAGIAAADIQTQSVSLDPRYSESGDEILGYTASNSVSATLHELGRAGAVVDAAVGAGANQVSGPSLTRADTNDLYRAALRTAIANATLKAQAIAASGHARLGLIRSVTESSTAPPPVAGAAKAAPAAPSTPVEPGTQLVEADVVVTFTLG